MATIGQRGKTAEGEVKKWMTRRSDADAGFWFYRYPDPRAGSLQAVPADFGALHVGVPFLVEVKEVKVTGASRRLPAKNFSADKVARMKKFAMAGGQAWVAVCFMPAKEWRLVSIDVFEAGKPSWDLARYPTYVDVNHVLTTLFGGK